MLSKAARRTLTILHSLLFVGSIFMILTTTGFVNDMGDFLSKTLSFFLWVAVIGTPFITAAGAIITWKKRDTSKRLNTYSWMALGWFVLHLFLLIWLLFFAIESQAQPEGNSSLDWLLSTYAIFIFPVSCAVALYLLTPAKKKVESNG